MKKFLLTLFLVSVFLFPLVSSAYSREELQSLILSLQQTLAQMSNLLSFQKNLAAVSSATSFAVGDVVQTTDLVNIRSNSVADSAIIGAQNLGALGIITAGPVAIGKPAVADNACPGSSST